ncbi:MAG: site-specific integrase [Bdellovibrionales bacterium]|jgi:integrase|nr:site-specific integrase [Bdellovibrionales bacterium]
MPIYTETKDGKTTYMVVATAQINGKQHYKKRRNISSMAHAKRIEVDLRLLLRDLKNNPIRFTWNEWIKVCFERMRIEFKKSTLITYQGNLGKWVSPHIGHLYLNEITSSMVHDVIFNKVQNVGMECRRTVLKQTKRIFTMAIDEGLLTKNPAKPIIVKVPESEQLVFNRTEIDTLLYQAKLRDHPFYNHWVMALLTGMRTGELHALMWTDIDFENRVISVTKSWSKVDGTGPTKSSKNRYIPISTELEMFLKNLKAQQLNYNGKVLEPLKDWLTGRQAEILRKFCHDIAITEIKFHDLRATFITQMLIRGVALAKVMKIVGHANIKTTMRYLRLVAQDTQGATESLGITLPKDFNNDNVVNLFQR